MYKQFLILIFSVIFLSCGSKKNENPPVQETKLEKAMSIKIRSSVFEEGGMIPKKYTCDGENVSPPLSWSDAPSTVKSYAIICDDPDAPGGIWVHWVIYNIPGGITELPEAIPSKNELDNGSFQGMNDFRKTGYGGPCPPSGTHRYFFKIYALDKILELKGEVSKESLTAAMKGYILAEGQLMGKYKK